MKPLTPRETEETDPRNIPFAGGGKPRLNLKPVHIKNPPTGFRRLHENEVVSPGDYVLNELLGVEPWAGPGGFRTDSFSRQIHRRVTAWRLAAGDPSE